MNGDDGEDSDAEAMKRLITDSKKYDQDDEEEEDEDMEGDDEEGEEEVDE